MRKAILLIFFFFLMFANSLEGICKSKSPCSVWSREVAIFKPLTEFEAPFTITNIKQRPELKQPSSDTINNAFNKKVQQYKNSLSDKLKLPSDSLIQDNASSYVNSKVKTAKKQAENPVNLSVENNLIYLTENPLKSGPALLNSFSIAGEFAFFKIPLNLDVSNIYSLGSGFEPFQSNLFKFNFNKESMLNSFKSDLERFTDFKSTFLKGMELPDFTRKAVLAKLKSMPEVKSLGSSPAFLSFLKDPEKINTFLNLDEKQLKEKVSALIALDQDALSESAKKEVNNTKAALKTKPNVLDTNKTLGDLISKTEKVKTLTSESEQQKLKSKLSDTIISVISAIRNNLAENGLDAHKVQLVQKIISGKVNIDDVETELFNEISKSPKAGKFQSVFSKVREFQTGAFGNELPGSFLNRDLFVKGLNLSFKTKQGPVSLGFGKQNDIGTSKDAGFQNSVYSSPRTFSYLSVPTNLSSFGSGKLSWVGSFSSMEDKPAFQSATMGRNSMTLTLSQAITTQKMGKFTVDVSKSASQYNNTLSPGSENLMLDKGALSNYFSDNIFETMSMGLNHDLESKRMNMSSNFYFNYAGVGFQNPGSAGGSNMKMRFGGNLKKKFYNNRLTISLRSDLRNTPVSFSSNAHWQNLQLQFDSRMRLNKKVNLNLKYMENDMNKLGEVSTPVYSSRKLQFGGNANYKIAGKYSFSNITLAQQQVINHQFASSGSNFITLNYLQGLVLKNTSISASIFYNKETSAIKLIGDMLNGDFSYQYSFLKMNITSSVTFLDNKDVAHQIGVKQNLQLLAGKHFDISAYADLRKNLITPLYPDLYAAGRAELSIKYYLKNKF